MPQLCLLIQAVPAPAVRPHLACHGPPRSGGLTFDNNSAFPSNVGTCSFKNDSTVTVNARNNQWRGAATGLCASSPDLCTGGGTINCDPVQNYLDLGVTLDTGQPTFPSNEILRGQTVRVQGSGFNAIDGNPPYTQAPPNDCAIGNADVSSYNCCRKTAKANVCQANTSPPEPLSGKGNCVALKNSIGNWNALPVTGVTPTTIVGELPAFFACTGNQGEAARVSKKNSVGTTLSAQDLYCLNSAGL